MKLCRCRLSLDALGRVAPYMVAVIMLVLRTFLVGLVARRKVSLHPRVNTSILVVGWQSRG